MLFDIPEADEAEGEKEAGTVPAPEAVLPEIPVQQDNAAPETPAPVAPAKNANPQQHKHNRPAFNIEFEGIIFSEGVLEMMQDGYGFLRSSDYNY